MTVSNSYSLYIAVALVCSACADVNQVPTPRNGTRWGQPEALHGQFTTVDEELEASTNVLILLLDDVGVDRLGAYGAEFAATTPVIDGLANEGVVFENAWGESLCAPARAALQTGRHPRRTGFGHNPEMLFTDAELDPRLVTLAEVVDQSPNASWSSSYVGKWHLATYASTGSTLSPVVQGWDWWSGSMANLSEYQPWKKVGPDGTEAQSAVYATTDSTDDAIARASAMQEPWLLQVSFNAAHRPFHVPPSDLHTDLDLTPDASVGDLQRAMIEAMDTEIGRLLENIPADILARTTIFTLGDNGTPAGALIDEVPDTLRSKGSQYDGGVRVPFIVTGALVPTPATTKVFAQLEDVFPTVADIAGVDLSTFGSALDPTAPLEIDGVSLLPTLANPAVSSGRTLLYTEEFQPGGGGPYWDDIRAIRTEHFKLIRDVCGGFDQFFEYVLGVDDEGPDLLALGPLTKRQEKAYKALRRELELYTEGLTYDASTWPVDPDAEPCADVMDTGTGNVSD